MGKVPIRQKGKRVLIICEGFEEYDYLNRIKECAVWSQDILEQFGGSESTPKVTLYPQRSSIYRRNKT